MQIDKLRLYDNTETSTARRCLRLYYYRHIRKWKTTGIELPLIFGGSWHAAMDVIWAALVKPESLRPTKQRIVTDAIAAFTDKWMDYGMPPPDEIDQEMYAEMAPRTPGQAMEMIVAYVDYRLKIGEQFELVSVEQAFAVPLTPDDPTLFYVGKIDKIVKRRGKILGIEHKTTTAYRKNGPFRGEFTDSFSPNSQVDGYLYALHMMHPGEVGGVWVDAALVHKQEEGFMFIPIERRLEHLDNWLWEVLWWVNIIEQEKKHLEGTKPDDKYMQAFPKNTNSCWDFHRMCPYMGLCKAWPNPMGRDIPQGFKEEEWSPLTHIPNLAKVLSS